MQIAGREVQITNPDKVFFPVAGYTKGDLLDYYLAVAEGAVRGVSNRPMALKRFVQGAEGEAFFQKRAPANRPPWIEKSYATQIALPPLSPEESLRLAQSFLPGRELPEPLAQVILSRAEGNPFFLEELTRAVTDRGDLQVDIAVPDTVTVPPFAALLPSWW